MFGTTNKFGGGASGWGSSNTSSQATSTTVNNGTSSPSYQVTVERESPGYSSSNMHTIVLMSQYRNWSVEELRMKDYELGKKGTQQQSSTGFGFGSTPATTTATTTGFGSTSTGFGSGFGSGGTFGQPAATTATTGFGGTSGFGTSPTTTTASTGFGGGAGGFGSGFGQQPSTLTSGFGQPTTTSTTTGFGQNTGFGGGFGQTTTPAATTTTGFGFGAQPASTSTFGQGTTSGFGTSNTFGQPAATSTGFGSGFGSNTSSGFGSKPATSTTTTGFGQPAQTSGFGGFGQPTATSTTTGFGQQPTQTSGFGGFGSNNKPAFGTAAPATTTGGLFGSAQPASTSSSLFGQTQPTTTTGFGQPAQSTTTSTGLFGQAAPSTTSTFGFGNNNNTTSAFGAKPTTTTTSAFGTGGTSGGLFGTSSAQTSQPQSSFSFGNSNTTTQPAAQSSFSFGNTAQPSTTQTQPLSGFNFGTTSQPQQQQSSSLFQTTTNNSQQPQQSQVQGPSLTASIDQNAYGTSALLQPKQQTAISPAEKTAAPQEPKQKFFPSQSHRRKDQVSFTPRRPMPIMTKASDVKPVYTTEKLVAKASVKKIDLSALVGNKSESTFRGRSTMNDSFSTDKKQVTWSTVQKDESFVLPSDLNSTMKTPIKRLDFRSPSPKIPDTLKELPDKYSISPPLKTLQSMSSSDLKSVANFSITHTEYGVIQWLEPVDLSDFAIHGESVLHRIPGEVVVLTLKACEVYPQSENSWWTYHSRGHGLNRPAEITLYNCYPGKQHDVGSPRMKQFVLKLKNKKDTHFISYDSKTAVWKFRVDHFSRYGVDPADEEYTEEENHKPNGQTLFFEEPIVVKTPVISRDIKRLDVNVLPSSSVRSVLFKKESPKAQPVKPAVQQPAQVQARLDAVQLNAIELIKKEAQQLPQIMYGAFSPVQVKVDTQLNEYTKFSGRVVFVNGSACLLKSFGGIITIEKVQIGPELSEEYVGNVALVLDKQLQGSTIKDGAVQVTKVKFNEVAALVPQGTFEQCLWDLMAALFDEIQLPLYQPQYEEQCRKRLFSEWLKAAVSEEVDAELAKLQEAGEDRSMQAVLHLITGRRIEEAVMLCIELKEYMLATVVGQVGDQLFEGKPFGNHGGLTDAVDLSEYLKDAQLSNDVRMVYQLLDSDMQAIMNKFKFGWLRCFALYYWYYASQDTPFSEIVEAYEADPQSTKPSGDMLYAVIKQYVGAQGKFSSGLVEDGVIPSVRLLWHTTFAGVSQLQNADWLCLNYAAELEAMSLWHLSAFVLMHLQNESQRRSQLQCLLERNVSTISNYGNLLETVGWPASLIEDQEVDKSQIEQFLESSLKISSQVVHDAKAAVVQPNSIKQALHYFLAGQQEKAHFVLMAHHIPSMFIAEQYAEIKAVLVTFQGESIAEWFNGGQLYLNFFQCTEAQDIRKVYALLGRLNKSNSHDLVTKHVYEEMASQLIEILYQKDALLNKEGQQLILDAPLPMDKRVQLVHDLAELVC